MPEQTPKTPPALLQLRHTIGRRSDEVNSVAWSPDGRTLAVGASDSTVRLWDMKSGAPPRTLEGHDSTVLSVVWSPDGRSLASGSSDRTVRVWDAATGKLRLTLEGHRSYVFSVAWSADGNALASGSGDGTVRVWDARTGEPRRTLVEGHNSIVFSVAWSPDGHSLASGSGDRTVRVWDVEAEKLHCKLEGHTDWVRGVAWSPDGQSLASGGDDSTVRVWDARTGEPRLTLEGHLGYVYGVAWSPDGHSLASGADSGTVRLWDARTGEPRLTLEEHNGMVFSVAWSPDGRSLASGSSDRTVRVWDARTSEPRRTLRKYAQFINLVRWSPDGRSLASGSSDRTVRVWDARTGATLRKLEGHDGTVFSVAWSPDGRSLASGSGDRTVRVWDARTGATLRKLEGHHTTVFSVAWSPDGQSLASGGDDRTVRVWNARTGEPRLTLEGHKTPVNDVAWSPDGHSLASGAYGGTVWLWDARTGEPRRTLEGHDGTVFSMAWSPDGRSLASGADDGRIQIWDVESGKSYVVLERHKDSIRSLNWSPDGRFLASTAEGGSVVVWRSDTWEEVRAFEELPARLRSLDVSFFPAGQVVAPVIGDEVAGVRAWEVETGALLAAAPATRTVRFTRAKVVLLGESNVGKSCLAMRLAHDEYKEQGTTHGMRVWPMAPERLGAGAAPPPGEQRDVMLWDMGGQDEYRLVHQLFLDDTTLALVLFDPTRGRTAFEEVEGWNRQFEKQLRGRGAVKLLVGTKMDKESEVVDRRALEELVARCGFEGYYETSAMNGRGIAELRAAMSRAIDWEGLAKTSRHLLFQRIRDEVEGHLQRGEVVLFYSQLEDDIRREGPEEFDPEAVNTVVKQLALQGMIADTRLASGDRVLVLQIGEIERYAGSLILAARNNPRGVPALEEQAVTSAEMKFPVIEEERLPRAQERIVLESVVQLLLEHGLCLNHERLLIFPSLFQPAHVGEERSAPDAVSLYYDFSGAIDNIYSSLVVRLAVSEQFGRVRLGEDSAEFERHETGVCGLRKVGKRSGLAHLDLFFGEQTPSNVRDLFTVFVEEHLRKEGVNITEVLEMTCRKCSYRFDEPLLRERLAAGHADILCPRCETRNRISEGAKKVRSDDPTVEERLLALKTIIERKSRAAVGEIKRAFKEADRAPAAPEPVRILHLSDLHFHADDDPLARLQPLVQDILDRQGGLGFERLDYLVVSGDLTNRATPEEFETVYQVISKLIERFRLSSDRCLIVPGNHDLSWETEVYDWKPERKVNTASLKPGSYVEQGKGYLVRDDESYPTRFENFRKFYHSLRQEVYPLAPAEQCLPFLFNDTRIQFLTLNSAPEIDEFYPERSAIHDAALSKGLLKADDEIQQAKSAGRLAAGASVLRIAVWHHPVTGNEKINDAAFLERLRKADVRLCLHGHVHEDRADVVGYLDPERKLYVAGAGSFGAPAKDRPESMPRLYNLIEVARDHSCIRVHTRCQLKPGGAWEGSAKWPGANPNERRTYYEIELRKH